MTTVLGVGLVAAVTSRFGGFPVFFVLLFLCVASLGLIFPNATALALVPFASQAGTASALLGTLQYALGASAGALVGLLHDGTALPMAGMIAACGLAGRLAIVVGSVRGTACPGFIDHSTS